MDYMSPDGITEPPNYEEIADMLQVDEDEAMENRE